MANTAIQNIKILHKRYSTDQWTNGIQLNGTPIIPKLAQGEIGLDTTTFEVRIGTNSASEQIWSQAHVIDAEVSKSATYYHKDGTSGTSAKEGATYVVTSCDLTNGSDGKHTLTLVYKDIELVAPTPDIPDLKVTDGTATAGEGEVVVVTGISEGSEHEVVSTKATAATKDFVTSRKLTVTKDGTGDFITGIKEVTNADGNHSVVLETGDVVIDIPELELSGADATGDYISGIEVADHKITVTKGSLPVGSGSKTAGDVEFIDSVKLEGHTLTATSKGIKGDDNVITVTKDTDGKVKISADTYTKAEIDAAHNDLAKAMKFAGTLDTTGANGVATLPSNAKQGDVYKVVTAGTYGSQSAKVGDLFIYDGSKWRYVPSGDESFTDTWRGIKVNGTTVKDNSIGSGDINITGGNAMSVTHADGTITISHNDTSSVEDASRIKLEVIDGLEFDEYGHVENYLKKKVVAGANVQLTEDEAGNLTISATDTIVTDTNTAHEHTAGQGLDITGEGGIDGNVEYAHKSITTSDAPQTAKTITAGSADNKFTVVEGYTADGMGHITEVKTREISVNIPVVEDKNTTYDLSATQNSTTTGTTSADITLTGSDNTTDKVNFKVDAATNAPADGLQVTVSENTITLSGKATADLLGLIKAAYNLNDSVSNTVTDGVLKNYSGNHLDKLYGVNVRNDGKAFVEVPWIDTHAVPANFTAETTPSTVDLYAFNTDEYGHVEQVYAVTTIDGNYA